MKTGNAKEQALRSASGLKEKDCRWGSVHRNNMFSSGIITCDKGKERALLKFDMLKSTLFNDVVMDDMASIA
jgi:hypothetical protein